METKSNYEDSEKASAGIIIGILDILAMIAIIAFLCSKDLRL